MSERFTAGGETLDSEKLVKDYEEIMSRGREIDNESENASLLISDIIRQLKSLITIPNAERTEDNFISPSHLSVVLDHIGLPSNEITGAWDKAYSDVDLSDPQKIDLRNYHNIVNYLTIMSLELSETNSAKVLYDEFGIKTFGRYSPQFLSNQLQNRDNRTVPYGMVLYTRADYNGACYSMKTTLDNLSNELEGSHTLRAYEIESKLDLVKSMFKAEQRYSPNGTDGHRLSFGILGGHGSGTAIHLDEGNHLSTLDTYFRNPSWNKRLANIFEDDASLILVSCSTGRLGGIAQQLSDALNVRVIAPEKDAGIETCNVETGDTLNFHVKYINKNGIVNTNIYRPGDKRKLVHLDLTHEGESHNYNPEVFRVSEPFTASPE